MISIAARDDLEVANAYVAPRDETEARLAELWSAKLRIAPIGVEDDFFELGGDSLLAADLQLAVDRAFGVEVPAWTLFLSPTIAELAQALKNAQT